LCCFSVRACRRCLFRYDSVRKLLDTSYVSHELHTVKRYPSVAFNFLFLVSCVKQIAGVAKCLILRTIFGVPKDTMDPLM